MCVLCAVVACLFDGVCSFFLLMLLCDVVICVVMYCFFLLLFVVVCGCFCCSLFNVCRLLLGVD